MIKHSPYFSETSFINLLGSNEGLTVLDLNVCNAFTKFDELELFVERVNINNPISVICLNECWLNSKSDLSPIHLASYNMSYQEGPGHGHCGLITYVHKTYRSEEININLDATGWEYLSIEILHNSRNAKKYVLTNVYRPPERFVDELNVFIQEFSSLLNFLQDLNRISFVCGDFNINLLEINSNPHYNDYFESIYSKGFFPRITMPTRIQPPSFSLIDNILCNSLDDAAKSVSGVLITDISDHKMIFTVHPNNSVKQKIDKFIEIEKRDQLSMDNFIDELASLNILDKLDKGQNIDPNNNYELFAQLIKYTREKHISRVKVRYQKKKHKRSKWLTNGILNSINTIGYIKL